MTFRDFRTDDERDLDLTVAEYSKLFHELRRNLESIEKEALVYVDDPRLPGVLLGMAIQEALYWLDQLALDYELRTVEAPDGRRVLSDPSASMSDSEREIFLAATIPLKSWQIACRELSELIAYWPELSIEERGRRAIAAYLGPWSLLPYDLGQYAQDAQDASAMTREWATAQLAGYARSGFSLRLDRELRQLVEKQARDEGIKPEDLVRRTMLLATSSALSEWQSSPDELRKNINRQFEHLAKELALPQSREGDVVDEITSLDAPRFEGEGPSLLDQRPDLDTPPPDQELIAREEALRYRQLLGQAELSPREMETFILFHSEGLTRSEIAQESGRAVGTIKSELSRAEKKVKSIRQRRATG